MYRVPSTPYLHLFPPRGHSRFALCFPTGRSSSTPPRRFRIAGVLLTGCRLIEHTAIAVGVRTLQLLSLSERAIGVQVIELKIEEGEIEVAVQASFEGLGLWLTSERIEQDLGVWRTK